MKKPTRAELEWAFSKLAEKLERKEKELHRFKLNFKSEVENKTAALERELRASENQVKDLECAVQLAQIRTNEAEALADRAGQIAAGFEEGNPPGKTLMEVFANES